MYKKLFFLAIIILTISACNTSPTSGSTDVIPTQTSAPTTAPTTVSPIQEIKLEDLNTIPPENVLDEVSYFGGAGGGGIRCTPSSEPTITTSPSIEYMQTLGILICLPQAEEVKVQITQDTGTQVFSESKSPDPGVKLDDNMTFVLINFKISPDVPTGTYKLTASTDNWNETQLLEIRGPSKPSFYIENNLNRLTLLSFRPNEKVRLFIYRESDTRNAGGLSWGTASLVGWKEYQVDARGKLELTMEPDALSDPNAPPVEIHLAVVGDMSGEVPSMQAFPESPMENYMVLSVSNITCGNHSVSDIRSGDMVKVIIDNLALLSSAGETLVNKGSLLQVTQGPYCNESVMRWNVACPEGLYNCSIPEVVDGQASIQKNDGTIASDTNTCPGTRPTQLVVGMRAVVSRIADEGLNIRGEPGMDKAKIHLLQPNDRVSIVKGPECADGALWWYVETLKGNYEGWVREGDQSDYWLIPWEQ